MNRFDHPFMGVAAVAIASFIASGCGEGASEGLQTAIPAEESEALTPCTDLSGSTLRAPGPSDLSEFIQGTTGIPSDVVAHVKVIGAERGRPFEEEALSGVTRYLDAEVVRPVRGAAEGDVIRVWESQELMQEGSRTTMTCIGSQRIDVGAELIVSLVANADSEYFEVLGESGYFVVEGEELAAAPSAPDTQLTEFAQQTTRDQFLDELEARASG